MYGLCETYGKASLMQRTKQIFQKKKGYVLMGVPMRNDWNSEF